MNNATSERCSLTILSKHVFKQERHTDSEYFLFLRRRFRSNRRLSDHSVDVDSLKLPNANTVVSFIFLLIFSSRHKRSYICLVDSQVRIHIKRDYSFRCESINYYIDHVDNEDVEANLNSSMGSVLFESFILSTNVFYVSVVHIADIKSWHYQ